MVQGWVRGFRLRARFRVQGLGQGPVIGHAAAYALRVQAAANHKFEDHPPASLMWVLISVPPNKKGPSSVEGGRPQTNLDPSFKINSIGGMGIGSGKSSEGFQKAFITVPA